MQAEFVDIGLSLNLATAPDAVYPGHFELYETSVVTYGEKLITHPY